ncbi:MAG: histidine-type phosphatase [Prevotella sp.]|nr:histidine-type phosphatase [Prevotella sp.]
MQKLLLLAAFITITTTSNAQSARQEILSDKRCSASTYMAYPTPRASLSPAPQGKHPFFISHYGRSGSRYHSKIKNYDGPWQVLQQAESSGKLTPLGRDVLHRIALIRQEATNRWYELTPLGHQQEEQIVQRMVEHFPEVFKDTAEIDARSMVFTRSIMSMESALLQLVTLCPQLRITHDASHSDQFFMNASDYRLKKIRNDSIAQLQFQKFVSKHPTSHHFLKKLFNDMNYVRQHVNIEEFSDLMFKLASIQQNTILSSQVTLYDIFSHDELYTNWKKNNVWWYVNYGAWPQNGGTQPYTQRRLLRKIITDADEFMQTDRHGAQLRYGDDVVVMPLICLLDLNGYGLATNNLESLESKGWVDYRVLPMAANIQFVFYRTDPQDQEVLFKVLLNEQEATLPLPADRYPYYRWSDFREYYLKKLDAYEK